MNTADVIAHQPILICDAYHHSYKICVTIFCQCSIHIWWCSMLPVPLHPDMYRSVMPADALYRSVLLRPTLLCLSPLRAACADLRLYVSLLWDLGYMPLHDTNICPDNTEELILDAKTMYEHVRGRDTLKLILMHTPPHYIRNLNYGNTK